MVTGVAATPTAKILLRMSIFQGRRVETCRGILQATPSQRTKDRSPPSGIAGISNYFK
jgi:hypothetical protein